MPPRILILTSGPLCRNPRVLKEAWTLGKADYAVTVMTVSDNARFEAIDHGLLRDAPFRKVALNLRGEGVLSRVSQVVHRNATRAARFSARFGYASPCAFGPYRALLRMARQHSADLVIAHTELALCVAHALAAEGRRVAADFEDWHSRDLLPSDQAGRPLTLLQRVEFALINSAAVTTTTTSDAMASALHAAAGGRRPVVITNSFPLQSLAAKREPSGPPAFYWFSQTIGPGRGLETFIDAWSQTQRPSRLCLQGEVSDDFRTALIRRTAPQRRADLAFLPLASPDELPAIIARHDVGLALETDAPANRNLTISNKILQYLNAGLAVVATRTAGQDEVMSRAPGAGITVDRDDRPALTAQLDLLLGDRSRLTPMQAAARRAAESTYCWEQEAPRLLQTVAAALRS